MTDFIKKQGIAAFIAAGSALLVFVSMILAAVSSGVRGYAVEGLAWVIICSILAIILVAASIFIAYKYGNKYYAHIGLLVAMVLCCICGFIVVQARAELVGTLWITALDSVNPLAVSAMNSGASSFILYFISMVGLMVSGCFSISKSK